MHIRTRGDERRCVITDKSPSLSLLGQLYGDDAPVMWLSGVLSFYNEIASSERKMDAFQIEACASAIAFEYFYLKASEMLLFFKLLLSGRFGKQVYGALDSYSVCSCIKDCFLPLRAWHIDEDEKEKRAARREQMFKDAVYDPERMERMKQELTKHLNPKNETADGTA